LDTLTIGNKYYKINWLYIYRNVGVIYLAEFYKK